MMVMYGHFCVCVCVRVMEREGLQWLSQSDSIEPFNYLQEEPILNNECVQNATHAHERKWSILCGVGYSMLGQ